MAYAKAEGDDKTLQEELLALQQAAAQEDRAQHECMAAIERAQVAVSTLQGELEADEDDGEAPDSEMEALRKELAACEDEAARAEEEARAREEEAAEQDEALERTRAAAAALQAKLDACLPADASEDEVGEGEDWEGDDGAEMTEDELGLAPGPFFSWAQAAEAKAREAEELRAQLLQQDCAARRRTAEQQAARFLAHGGGTGAAGAGEEGEEEVKAVLMELQGKRDSLREALVEVRAHKVEMQERIKQLEDEAKQTGEAEAAWTLSAHAELEDERSQLTSAFVAAQAEHELLKHKIQRHGETKARLEKELKDSTEQREALESLISQGRPPTEAEIGELHAYVEALEADRAGLIEQLEAEAKKLRVLNSTLLSAHGVTERMLQEFRPAVEAMQEEMGKVTEVRAGQEADIAQLRYTLEIGDRELRSRQAQLRRAKIELFIMKSDQESARRTVEQHNETYTQSNALLVQLQQSMAEEHAGLQAVQAELDGAIKINADIEGMRVKLVTVCREHEGEIRKLELEEKMLKTRLESLGMDNILAEQHKLNGIVGEEEAGIAHLRRDVASLQREREAAEDKRAMLKRQVSFLVDAQSGCMLARGDGEKEGVCVCVCVCVCVDPVDKHMCTQHKSAPHLHTCTRLRMCTHTEPHPCA